MFRPPVSVPIALVLASLAGCGGAPGQPAPDRPDAAVTAAFQAQPLTFVANRGQADSRVRFQVQGPGHAFSLTRDQVALTLRQPNGDGVNLALRFEHANAQATITGAERAPGITNYVLGTSRHTEIPGYQRVTYAGLWPGIDLTLSGRDGALKYEFRVRPGADAGDIALAYRGITGLRTDTTGGLDIDTARGRLTDAPPVAYQEIDGRRTPVASRFALHDGGGYGFATAGYDRGRDLIIDPSLSYSTFLGGASDESGNAIKVDAAGNAYVTGFTQSPDFPVTPGAFDRTGAASNNVDAFVTKLSPTGALVYSTFLGGTNFDWGRAIAVDSAGSAYVTGRTQSPNFPVTGGAFDRSFNVDNCPRCGIDQADVFVAKLNPAGSALTYSTFVGSTQPDDAFGIALDGARNAYVTGETDGANFPTTAGAFDRTNNGGNDGVVFKLNATGSALAYSTLLGGADNELPDEIAVDQAGNAVIGGSTRSADFPTTPGAFDTTQNGGAFDERFDLFVTKLNSAGSGLVYSTFIGGSKSDFGSDFALDAAGSTYVVGATLSPDFPTTPGSFDPVFSGTSESFALKLNPAGNALVYSTFLGQASAGAVAPDAAGNAWLAGSSGPGGLTTADAFAPFFKGGGSDAYLARLNAAGNAITFASFLGGSDSETANDVALDPSGNVLLAGHTFSPDFPTTPGAPDRTFAGDPLVFWGEAFVAKVDVAGTAPPVTPPAPAPAAPALGTPADAATVPSPVTFDWGDVSAPRLTRSRSTRSRSSASP